MTAELGTCAACGQELLRTAGDCWHPWNVKTTCPPEVEVDGIPRPAFGDGFGRPGRDKWRAAA